MSRRRKREKIAAAASFSNVIQPHTKVDWMQVFGASQRLTLELGCGTGAYTLALARLYPDESFVGVDVKGVRIWGGAKTALEEKLANAVFLRVGVEHLLEYIQPHSVANIWVTFPDPFPRKKQAKHRLTAPNFLVIYKKILVPGGKLNFKTDDEALFDYSVETAEACGWKVAKTIKNLYAQEIINPELLIQTTYEKKHLADGKKIFYFQAVPRG